MELQHGASVTENMFLTFLYKGFDFAIPLVDIERIAESVPDGAFVVGDDNSKKCCCVIASTGGVTLAIYVDEVYGLRYVAPEHQLEMPAEARCTENDWLFGVAFDEAENRPYYMLDCRLLAEHISDKVG